VEDREIIMRKKRQFLGIIIILILGIGGILGFNYWKSTLKSAAQAENQIPLTADLAGAVEVQRGNLKKTVSASGFLQPVNYANLNLRSSGTGGGIIEEILVDEGEVVEEGQKLVSLEDKEERLNYLQAKNAYELSKIDGSPSLLQEEKKLALDLAQEKLEAKTILAPFSGKIINIYVEEGDYVEPTDSIIYLIDETAYEVEVSISEVNCLLVEVGQPAEVELDVAEGEIFSGKVTEVADYTVAESNVVTVPVTIQMDEVAKFFRPGFSASVDIIVNSAENVLRVPVTALATQGDSTIVLKVEGDKVVPTPVKAGISDGYYQEVIEGLQEGDKIIVNNYQMNLGNSGSNQRNSNWGMGGPTPGPMPMMR